MWTLTRPGSECTTRGAAAGAAVSPAEAVNRSWCLSVCGCCGRAGCVSAASADESQCSWSLIRWSYWKQTMRLPRLGAHPGPRRVQQ
jgi:hypothetical protein